MQSVLGRRPIRKWAAAIQVTLLGLAAILITGSPASALSLPGTVLVSTTASLPPELSATATGKRITYVTTAPNGNLITATGLVLTPKKNKKNKTVAWAHGSTGIADRCAPSTNHAVFWPEARAAVAALIAKGWTVAAPDYPGLGTPAAHPYLIGPSEARSIIDNVKAARNLDSSLSTQYALDGHSQGGQGVLFAGQIAPAYDGNLVLKGVASIAPVSNARIFAPSVPGTESNGYLVMGLYGLAAQDPTFNPNSVLAPPARAKAPVLQNACLYDILDAYAPLTAEELLIGGTLPESVVAKLAQYVDPAQAPGTAPILLVQGTDDMDVPYDLTYQALLPQLEATSPSVTFVPVSGADHDGAVFATTQVVADWIAGRFT